MAHPFPTPYLVAKYTIGITFRPDCKLSFYTQHYTNIHTKLKPIITERQVIVIKANITPMLSDFLVKTGDVYRTKSMGGELRVKLFSQCSCFIHHQSSKTLHFTYREFHCISEIFELLHYYFWISFWDLVVLGISLFGVCSKNSIIRAHKIPLSLVLDVKYSVFDIIMQEHWEDSLTLHNPKLGDTIPTMKFFTGISGTTQSKSYMISLTEYVWEFQNNALWDTLKHAPFLEKMHSSGTPVTHPRFPVDQGFIKLVMVSTTRF